MKSTRELLLKLSYNLEYNHNHKMYMFLDQICLDLKNSEFISGPEYYRLINVLEHHKPELQPIDTVDGGWWLENDYLSRRDFLDSLLLGPYKN